MSTKWTTNGISTKEAAASSPDSQFAQGFVVLLLYGKNSFGDKIYSYLKVGLPNLPRLKTSLLSGKGFTPSDFGEVIAAGKGEPSPEIRTEIAAQYPVMDSMLPKMNPAMAGAAAEKKSWDEY